MVLDEATQNNHVIKNKTYIRIRSIGQGGEIPFLVYRMQIELF